jgi:acetylornithine deacetylase
MKSFSIFILVPMFAASLQPKQTPMAPETQVIDDLDWKLDLSTSDTLLDLHRRLVEIESITGNEKKVGKWLASYLEKQNLTVELQEVGMDRFNVFAYPGEERKTEVLVTSHIDTVIPAI